MRLRIIPCELEDANAYVRQHHRHHGEVLNHKFSIAVANDSEIVGVAIIGRPLARMIQDGWTLEVSRVCTDGTKNACSMLYAAAWRATRAIGYRRLITYTLDSESGASLKAAGWKCVAKVKGRSWDCPSRPRVNRRPAQDKFRWEAA